MAKVKIDNKKMWESLLDPLYKNEITGSLRSLIKQALKDQGLEYKDGKIVSIEPEPFKIEAGKFYMCIKDFSELFSKGKIYRSDSDTSVITNNKTALYISDMNAFEYFRPATPEEVLEAKHGITGIGSKKAEGKLGEMIKEKIATEEEIPHEPKFKEGDWVVYKNDVCQIVKREEGCNQLVTQYGIQKELVNERNLSTARLWDITKDAKDGDVLSYNNNQWIFIFKAFGEEENEIAYHALLSEKGLTFDNYNYSVLQCAFSPATKKQCDLLFAKMREAGYEWNAEKKEIRKLPTPSDVGFEELEERWKEEAESKQGLTEFEKALENWYNNHLHVCRSDNNLNVDESLTNGANNLLSIARKQIAGEINIDEMVSDGILCDEAVETPTPYRMNEKAYYRQGIIDTLKEIKGE